MDVSLTHYKAVMDASEISLEVKDYSGPNAHLCDVRFQAYFSNFITKKEENYWRTMLYGTHDLHFTEKLHHEEKIDIVNAREVKLCKSFNEFCRYAHEQFIPTFDLPYDKIALSESTIETQSLFLLDFFLKEIVDVVYVRTIEWFDFKLSKKNVSQFKLGRIYCKFQNCRKFYEVMPDRHLGHFKSLIADFEEGSSIIMFSEC